MYTQVMRPGNFGAVVCRPVRFAHVACYFGCGFVCVTVALDMLPDTEGEPVMYVCEEVTLCAVQVAAVSTAGRAYVWSCSAAEEDGRVTGSLTMRVSVEASSSETCVPLCTGQHAVHASMKKQHIARRCL